MDGSSEAPGVLADFVLSFRPLRPSGIMIRDDFSWPREPQAGQGILLSPKLAIGALTNIYRRDIYRRRLEFPDGLLRWWVGLREVPA